MPDLLSFSPDGVQFAWDATSLSNYVRCPRYYQYVNLEGWQPNATSPHLIFGGLFASALEHYFKHLAEGDDTETALRRVVHTALINSWEYERDEDGSAIPGTGQPWDSFHNTKTRATLIRSIVWYFEHFEDDPTETIILANGAPAVELSFSLPVEDGIIFCGHLDRLVDYGGPYVMDQKTTGSTITPRFFDGFSPDMQMSMYAFAGKAVFGIPVQGVIIDAAQIAVGFTRFERGFIHRPQPVLEEWYENTMHIIASARHATEENFFPMNPASCGNYGGCQFRKICSRSPEHRNNFLRADFHRTERWDPLKRR